MADIATTPPLTVVTLPAEIDMATAGAIGQQIAAALAPGAHAVIADMTATTFCDSAGIGMLIRAKKQAAAHGAELRLLLPCPNVLRVLMIQDLTHCCPSTTAWKKHRQAPDSNSPRAPKPSQLQ